MNDFTKILNNNLEYIRYDIENDIVKIWVNSNKSDLKCPYCNSLSNKVHSHYERNFQDLPIQGKKIIFFINNRKLFCSNIKQFQKLILFYLRKVKKQNVWNPK